MANESTVESRYMRYNKADVESLLDKIENADAEPTEESENMISSGAVAAALAGKQDAMDEATEENVRNIVKNWMSAEPEPEPEPETEP